MSAPTMEEEQLLIEFRERVKDLLETEEQQKNSFLIRWIRARDGNLAQAESMLKASLAWRKENRVNFMLERPVDTYFQQVFPYYIKGVDKHGQPVVVVQMGKWDFRKCASQETTKEFNQYINYCFEEICRAIEKLNKIRDDEQYPITQFTAIIDWKGYSYIQFCHLKAIQNPLYCGTTYEAHYPEVLSSCLFINCPSFFNVVMMMLKQILAAKTFGKVSVYGTNREEWEQAFQEIISDDRQIDEILKLLL